MAKKPSRRIRGDKQSEDLDLIPIIGIFGTILVFLILSSSFIRASVIDIYLPNIGEMQQETPKPEEIKVLMLNVWKNGFQLAGNLGKKYPFVPLKNNEFQYTVLVDSLKEIKKDHPDHQEIALLFKDTVKYKKIVKLIDSAREYPIIKNGETGRELFPNVSLGENLHAAPVHSKG